METSLHRGESHPVDFGLDDSPFTDSPLDELHAEWIDVSARAIDVTDVLDAVTAQLTTTLLDSGVRSVREDLVDLHGALLLYELGGRVGLLPSRSVFGFGRRVVERKIVAAAARLSRMHSAPAGPFYAWLEARSTVDTLIGAMDPDLGRRPSPAIRRAS